MLFAVIFLVGKPTTSQASGYLSASVYLKASTGTRVVYMRANVQRDTNVLTDVTASGQISLSGPTWSLLGGVTSLEYDRASLVNNFTDTVTTKAYSRFTNATHSKTPSITTITVQRSMDDGYTTVSISVIDYRTKDTLFSLQKVLPEYVNGVLAYGF